MDSLISLIFGMTFSPFDSEIVRLNFANSPSLLDGSIRGVVTFYGIEEDAAA
jgi:hypothetical protein